MTATQAVIRGFFAPRDFTRSHIKTLDQSFHSFRIIFYFEIQMDYFKQICIINLYLLSLIIYASEKIQGLTIDFS